MSSRVRLAEISDQPLSVDRLLGLVSDRATGGIAIFVGVVREQDSGEQVSSLDYTQHPTATAALHASAGAGRRGVRRPRGGGRASRRSPEVGDLAVVVATGAVHRGPALDACRALIDDLKETVPIWKEQHLTSGDVTWVGLP